MKEMRLFFHPPKPEHSSDLTALPRLDEDASLQFAGSEAHPHSNSKRQILSNLGTNEEQVLVSVFDGRVEHCKAY